VRPPKGQPEIREKRLIPLEKKKKQFVCSSKEKKKKTRPPGIPKKVSREKQLTRKKKRGRKASDFLPIPQEQEKPSPVPLITIPILSPLLPKWRKKETTKHTTNRIECAQEKACQVQAESIYPSTDVLHTLLASTLPASPAEEVHHAPRATAAAIVPLLVSIVEFPLVRPHALLRILLLLALVRRSRIRRAANGREVGLDVRGCGRRAQVLVGSVVPLHRFLL
jgi:hypothetical protein